MRDNLPGLGVGLGYRLPLHEQVHAHSEQIDFLELISDHYLFATPEKLDRLEELGRIWPLIPHGVGMSIGSATPPDPDYLDRLATLVSRVDAPWFSDHLSFTKVPDTDVEHLTPLWFTEESLDAVCRNVQQVKRVIDRPFLLENITYYYTLPGNEMSEAEFTTRVLEETDIGLLLDVNNVWINSVNHGFDPYEFLRSIPLHRTVQIHIAGGRQVGDLLVDTHGAPVHDQVWQLLDYVLARVSAPAILLEWDQDWPDFDELLGQLRRARTAVSAGAAA